MERVEPGIDDAAQGTTCRLCRRKSFAHSPVDGLEVIQLGFTFAHLNFGCRKSLRSRSLGQPAVKEGLAGPVLAADRLKPCASGANDFELVREDSFETF